MKFELTAINGEFGRTVAQAEPYLAEPAEPVDILISGDWKQLQEQQLQQRQQPQRCGGRSLTERKREL